MSYAYRTDCKKIYVYNSVCNELCKNVSAGIRAILVFCELVRKYCTSRSIRLFFKSNGTMGELRDAAPASATMETKHIWTGVCSCSFIYSFFKSGWGEEIYFFCNSLNFYILFTLLFQCIFFVLFCFQYRRMFLVVLVLNVFGLFILVESLL